MNKCSSLLTLATTSYKDMWWNSGFFRIFMSINACLFAFLLAVVFASFNTYRFGHERADKVTQYIHEYQEKLQACNDSYRKQESELKDLANTLNIVDALLSSYEKNITGLKQTINILKENTVKLKNDTIGIRQKNTLWLCYAGIGTFIGALNGFITWYISHLNNNCKHEFTELINKIDTKESQVRELMATASDYEFMETQGYVVGKDNCYTSTKSKYRKDVMMRNCTEHEGAGTLIELETEHKKFGEFISKKLPNNTSDVYDSKAFIYIPTENVIAPIKPEKRSFAFSESNIFTIGKEEIVVSSASEEDGVAKVKAGESFEFNKNLYDSKTTFGLKSLNVYNLKIKRLTDGVTDAK